MNRAYLLLLKNPHLIIEFINFIELFPFVETIEKYNMSCNKFSIGSWVVKTNIKSPLSNNRYIDALHLGSQWKIQIDKSHISVYDPNRGWLDLTNDEWVNIYKIYLNPELLNFL